MLWKRDEIRKLLEDLDCSIREVGPGGDWDITGFSIVPNDSEEWISITPFKDPAEESNSSNASEDELDNCEIYAIEVRTDGDCEGGLQTEDEKEGAVYGRICARLTKAGFYVIPHYDKIF